MRFVGRDRELKKLNELYQEEEFQFVVIYGRRRVGKTMLINEFLKKKRSAYYMAVEGTSKENLSSISKVLLAEKNEEFYMPEFPDFESLLSYIDHLCKNTDDQERLVIAIDEFPYLAGSYPAISSMLQSHIDQCWKDSNLFLILCGSSMSFMEEQVLGYKSPLYGRRTAQFKLHPFTYFEARQMLSGFKVEEQAVLYGVTGGIPEYLSRIHNDWSMDDNIKKLFFDESGRLFDEPGNLLKQELQDPSSYHSIITAIAGGASRLNEIATKTGLASSGCSAQIQSLITLGIIKKETPLTEGIKSRKTLYTLEDFMFLFWYRFIRPNLSGIMRGIGETIYEVSVKPQISHFMGYIFEEICKQYLYLPQIYMTLPFPTGEFGRWWGNNPKKKRQEEIDLMAENGSEAIFGECKWRNEPADVDILETLQERSGLFHYQKQSYMIFSKSGFTEKLKLREQEEENVRLISFEDMNQL